MGVIVLGAHRSGTSAMAELISTFGFSTGDEAQQMPPTEANRRGYFESMQLMHLNDRILGDAGGSVFAPPIDVDYSDQLSRSAKDYLAEFQKEFPDSKYVWKDPRLSLTFGVWRELLEDIELVVLMVRHPLAVAESLRIRGDIPDSAAGLAIWECYTREAMRASTGLSVLVVDYDEMIKDPTQIVVTVQDALASVGSTARSNPIVSASVLDNSLQRSPLTAVPIANEQLELWRTVSESTGFHSSFQAPPQNALSPAASQVLASRSTLARLSLDQFNDVMRLTEPDDNSEQTSPMTVSAQIRDLQQECDESRREVTELQKRLLEQEASEVQVTRDLQKKLLASVDGLRGAEAAKGAALGRLALLEHEVNANRYHQARWGEEVAFLNHEATSAKDRLGAIESSRSWRLARLAGTPVRVLRRFIK